MFGACRSLDTASSPSTDSKNPANQCTTSKKITANNNMKVNGSAASIDYDYFMNSLSKGRCASEVREITSLMAKVQSENAVKFAVGVPNGLTFPFKEVKVTLKDNSAINIAGERLADALQYLPSAGFGRLIDTLKDIQDRTHGPLDWNSRSIIVTNGSQEGLSKTAEMILELGDPMIIQTPMYSGAFDCLRPYKCDFIKVDTNQDPMLVKNLRNILEDRKKKHKKMPKIMYVNPTASNPCGVTMSEDTKREIYQLVCDYNFLILEDDPYFYLGFGEKYPVSFLSMDTEGRVMRGDSFSKILSSGLRVGFMTGPTALIRQLELHIQVSTLHPSGLSQIVVYELLQNWGFEGLRNHFAGIQSFYRERRDLLISAAQKHLTGLAEWNIPDGGMFLWLRVEGIKDGRSLSERCIDNHLFFLPGAIFLAGETKPAPYIRLSYSLCSPNEIETGIARLANLIREEQLAA